MESALRPLADHLTCEHCQQSLRDRIKNLVMQWSLVKVRHLFQSLSGFVDVDGTFHSEQYNIR